MTENRREITAFVGRTADGDHVYVDMSITTDDREVTTIEHEKLDKSVRLSASGFVIEKGRRQASSAGQMLDELVNVSQPAPGWTTQDIGSLLTLWRRWHLNDMRAGCAHQTPVYAPDQYGRNVPSLDLTQPCPLTGYRYGHAWLVEQAPAEVITEWERLMALPTGKVPTEC